MLFNKKINLRSPLRNDEIINKLKRVTEKEFTNTLARYKFEGKITSHTFLIYPTFDYGSNYRFRPEIVGLITKESEYNNLIQLEFRLSIAFKLLLISVCILNLGFIVYMYMYPIDIFLTWKVYAIALFFTGLIFLFSFHSKVQQSIYILSNLLKARNKK